LIVREMKGDAIVVVGLRLAGSDDSGEPRLRPGLRAIMTWVRTRLRIVPSRPSPAPAAPTEANIVPLRKTQGD